jgi:PhnB protein
MTTNRLPIAPDSWPTVIPRIVADDTAGLVAFIKQVFAATGEHLTTRPSELRIGDSMIMVSDASARKPMPAFLYVYVSDAAATYRLALNAGAKSIEEPFETPYGDRRCMVEDAWGNIWQIANRARR